MTGTEISAENPGLTARAGARLSLTPSGLCLLGVVRLLPELPSRSGSRPRWGCGETGLGKTKKLEERSWFLLQGDDFFGNGRGRGGRW